MNLHFLLQSIEVPSFFFSVHNNMQPCAKLWHHMSSVLFIHEVAVRFATILQGKVAYFITWKYFPFSTLI